MELPEIPPEGPQSALEDPSLVPSFAEQHGISPVLFGILCLAAVFFTYQIIGGGLTLVIFGAQPGPAQVSGYRAAQGLGQLLLILVPALLFVRLITRSPRPFLRLNVPDIRTLLIPIVGIFSLQEMLQIYLVFQDKIPLPEELQKIIHQFKDLVEELEKLLLGAGSVPELLWVIVIVAVIPALAEEFLFRGLIQRCFENGLGAVRGIVVTGIIFAAYHLNPFSFVPLAVLGMYLGFIAYRADSIWTSVAAHFYNNAFACVASYLNMSEDSLVVGDPGKLSPAFLLAAFWFFGVVFLLSVFYFLRVTAPREKFA